MVYQKRQFILTILLKYPQFIDKPIYRQANLQNRPCNLIPINLESMDRSFNSSFTSGKHIFPMKTLMSKTDPTKTQKPQAILSKSLKKCIPDQQSARIILNYFLFNNFQDFNTWQQIAKTKTDYRFDQIPDEKFECELIFKWENQEKENLVTKGIAKNKRNAKRKALTCLVQNLIQKGQIGLGFKDSHFIQKLPRRKKYESSSSQEDNAEAKTFKNHNILSIIKQKNHEKILQILDVQNVDLDQNQIFQVWNFALYSKNLQFCHSVLTKFFDGDSQILTVQQFSEPQQKQVSYVEQSKDPFQEDLTVFIRYQQLQRPKYQQKTFNEHQINSRNLVAMSLPSFRYLDKAKDNSKFSGSRQFITVQQKHQLLIKKHSLKRQERKGFFQEQKPIKLPKFQQSLDEQRLYALKTIEKLYNHVLYICQDYNFGLNILNMMNQVLKNVQFCHSFNQNKKTQEKQPVQTQIMIRQKYQAYYREMKNNLLAQMLYNLKNKLGKQNLARCTRIQGMLNFASAHSKFQGIFQFVPKEPEEIVNKKLQRKGNLSQFFQHNQFCTQQAILLVNKITQKTYIGIIKQLSQSFKMHVPFLLFSDDFPAPFSIHKLLNIKLFNRISSALLHTCKYYMNYVDFSIDKAKNVLLIYQTPSGPHLGVIQELVSEWIAKRMFTLIVSQNYQSLHKKMSEKGFRCVKILNNSDQKLILKHNIICASPLNVCSDLMKNMAFDRVIIDEAHRVPEIISLLSIIKCTKKVYLIGDPNLALSQMKSPLSKSKNVQKSLFEKFLKEKSSVLSFNRVQIIEKQQASQQNIIFDENIIQWAKSSIYGNDIITNQQEHTVRRTPLIKGFNWPSKDYRLCFLNIKHQQKPSNTVINQGCFLITWIIAEVLKSRFTDLEQISCCTLQSNCIPVLQQHLVKILIKLEIQPLQCQLVFQSLVKKIDGSRLNSNDLIMLLASDTVQSKDQKSKSQKQVDCKDEDQMQRKLTSVLIQAERGLIIVGQIDKLSAKSRAWANFIDWMGSKKLILTYKIPN